MPVDNATVMAHAWLEGTSDFQQRIPSPTQSSLQATVQALQAPLNKDLWNQFCNKLNNTIGYTLIDALRWDNPFDGFRRESLRWGNSIREVMPKWIKSHTYSDTSKNLLDIDKADFEQWYYSINYETKYPWDLNRAELLRAMSAPDGSTAINDLYNATSIQALNSDSYDIALANINCIRQADGWGDGIFRHQVVQGTDESENAKAILQAIKTFVYKFTWPSQLYNHINIPVFVNPRSDELVVFVTPETRALIDVRAYAELFNVNYALMPERIVMIPEIPIANCLALITTRNFIHWHDTVYGIYSFFNIDTLNDHSILHHQAIIAPNPSVPVVAIVTDTASNISSIVMEATALTLNNEVSYIAPGGTLDLNPLLEGTITENTDGLEVVPDSATYEITSDAVLNSRTYVDKYGVLHCQNRIAEGSTITVVATSTYYDPGADTQTELTATVTVTVGTEDTGSGNNNPSLDPDPGD